MTVPPDKPEGHRPKTAALAAYEAGALSASRHAQVEAHLSGCAVCRAELAAMRLWSRESAKMRAIRDVPVDFGAMELTLAREAKAEAKKIEQDRSSRRALPWLAPLGLAAAVLLTLGLSRWIGSDARPASTTPVATVALRTSAGEAEVVLVAGAPRVRGGERPLEVGDRLRDGAVIDTGTGEAHLALGATPRIGAASELDASASVAVRADSTLHLVAMWAPGGDVSERQQIELIDGAATVRAGGFSSESRVTVLAAGYRIEAVVALFDVLLPAPGETGVVIEVAEGRIHVTGNGVDEVLVAPARFAPPDPVVSSVGARRGGPARIDGALVRVERPAALRWDVDGLGAVEGNGAISFRAPAGPLHMISFDDLGRSTELSEIVGPNGLRVAGEPLEPTAPTVRGFLDPAVATAVIRASMPDLQRCYEHALRLRPELGGGSLVLRVSVAADGSVTRTRVDGDEVPATLQACVTSEAVGWTFPSPGAPVSFDQRLTFRPR